MMSRRARMVWIGLGLVIATLASYAPVFGAGYLNFDDGLYIERNSWLELGLSWDGIRWAFTTTFGGTWHPLTWLSLLADYELFALDPARVHAVNVALHALASLLLFLVLVELTGALGRSAFVAALFALHPAHVESVAWAVERKDVLSAVLFMLLLLAYPRAARSGSTVWRLAVPSLLALGLMAKPMLVTAPAVLLLLDDWPLGRLRGRDGRFERARVRAALLEKLPLLALVLLVAGFTLLAQRGEGAVGSLVEYPLGLRLGNALVAYVAYLWTFVWPVGLAVLYPYDESLSPLVVLASAAVLAALGVGLWRLRERRYLVVGALWFAGMLVPVLGLVQVGLQSRADRYTYLPFIGLSLALAWGAPPALRRIGLGPRSIAVLAVALLAPLAFLTYRQAELWREPLRLFQHTVAVTGPNPLAQQQLGHEYAQAGDLAAAERHYLEALRLYPHWPPAEHGLANLRAAQGRTGEAILLYRGLLGREFDAQAANNLAWLLATRAHVSQAEAREALRWAERAVEASPRPDPSLLDTLAASQAAAGAWDQAVVSAERALVLARERGDESLAAEIAAHRARYLRRERAR
jgi:hypothetical protein